MTSLLVYVGHFDAFIATEVLSPKVCLLEKTLLSEKSLWSQLNNSCLYGLG